MKRKRKKKSKIYFGTPVHDAIVKYNHSEDTYLRHKIYTEEIHAAFMKHYCYRLVQFLSTSQQEIEHVYVV